MSDVLTPTPEVPDVFGTDVDETIVGDSRQNFLSGGGGDDVILGGQNNDFVLGGRGRDVVVAGPGIDFVQGETGNDVLEGGPGADQFSQQYGPRLNGDPNDPYSEFGPTLPGFFSTSAGAGIDTIIDFNESEGDFIYLDTETAVDGQLVAIDGRGFLDSDQNGILNHSDDFVSKNSDGITLHISTLVENVAGVQINSDHRIIIQGVDQISVASIVGNLNETNATYNTFVLILTPDTLPELSEKQPVLDSDINGVDRGQFVTASVPRDDSSNDVSGDATISFVSADAGFQSSLGVYLIGDSGEIQDPKIVFAQIDRISPSDNAADAASPDGGPPSPGDTVSLSELYEPSVLTPGTEFGLFLIANGFARNPSEIFESGSFEFRDNGHLASITDQAPALVHIAEDGTETLVRGNIMHSVDAGSLNPLSNTLNPSGEGQVLSGVLDGDYNIAFEDKPLSDSDRDFTDLLVTVDSTNTYVPTDLPPPTAAEQWLALLDAGDVA